MSQSLTKLYVHLIFHVKNNRLKIRQTEEKELYAYIASILKDNESLPVKINGTEDHIHILCVMSKNISLSKLTEEIKRHSSRWIKTKNPCYAKFSWQGGYAGFSVSPSICNKTKRYIINQKEHHKTVSFKEEYIFFLKEYDIDYDERYLWNG